MLDQNAAIEDAKNLKSIIKSIHIERVQRAQISR